MRSRPIYSPLYKYGCSADRELPQSGQAPSLVNPYITASQHSFWVLGSSGSDGASEHSSHSGFGWIGGKLYMWQEQTICQASSAMAMLLGSQGFPLSRSGGRLGSWYLSASPMTWHLMVRMSWGYLPAWFPGVRFPRWVYEGASRG